MKYRAVFEREIEKRPANDWDFIMKNKHGKEFLEFSLSRVGVFATRYFGAYFKLKRDIRSIFPYINASLPEVRYYDSPEHLQFYFEGIRCTLYPHELIAASFLDEKAALSFFGRFMDFIEDLYRRQNEMEPDYRKYSPSSVVDILKLVPRSNCGECGYANCMLFAVALRNGETTPDHCPGFAQPISTRKVYPVFDELGNLAATVTMDIDALGDGTVPISRSRIESDGPKIALPENNEKSETDSETLSADFGNAATEEFQAESGKIGEHTLTQREIQVLRLITSGSTNAEIADGLGISPHTVKSHVVHIFNKLGVNDRTQAAVWATRFRMNEGG